MIFRDKGNVSLTLAELTLLRKISSPLHEIVFYRHPRLGKVLVVDGEIQHVEAWAPLYHEPLVHLPCSFISVPKTALILGGGSLFAARELLKYRSIEDVLLIDHDAHIVEAVCELYDHAATTRSDKRLKIQFADAFHSIKSISAKFDLVLNDAVDFLNVRNCDVFDSVFNLLSSNGIGTDLIYRHVFEKTHLSKTFKKLYAYKKVMSLVFVPEYPGILHLLMLWGKNKKLSQSLTQSINIEHKIWAKTPAKNPCQYFDPRFMNYYLYLPDIISGQTCFT